MASDGECQVSSSSHKLDIILFSLQVWKFGLTSLGCTADKGFNILRQISTALCNRYNIVNRSVIATPRRKEMGRFVKFRASGIAVALALAPPAGAAVTASPPCDVARATSWSQSAIDAITVVGGFQ
jgi:hypothetical protein